MNALELEPVKRLFALVVDPLVKLLLAAAVLYFVVGVFNFIKSKTSGDTVDIGQGKRHVLWGIIGIFIMISVWGIIAILRNTVGV